MKIIVPLRPVFQHPNLDKRTGKLVLNKEKVDVNPHDRTALDVALSLKQIPNAEIVAVSVGGETSEQILREALAAGVDHSILVEMPDEEWIGHSRMAWILAAILKRVDGQLAIFGSHSPDGLSGEIAGLVAGLLNLRAIAEAESIQWNNDELTVVALEGKELRRHLVDGVCILALSSNLTRRRRYPNLWNIHKAFTDKLEKISPGELRLEPALESFIGRVKTVSLIEVQREEFRRLRIANDSSDMTRLVIREINQALGSRGPA